MLTVHCVVVYRNKKDSTKYMMSSHTIACEIGEKISKRMETVVTVEASSWAKEWELVNFSHSFLPFNVGYQI